MSLVRFTVEGLPPTDNNAYRSGDGLRRYLTEPAKLWKQQVGLRWMVSATAEQRRLFEGAFWMVEIRHYLAFYTTKRKVRKWDVSSHQKLTVDALASAMHSDDSNCTLLVVSKAQRKARRDETVIEVRIVGRP